MKVAHERICRDGWMATSAVTLINPQAVTRIGGLESDPHLHGGGLHFHPPGSRLEMHLDYSIHPISKKERRVNLIVYMNRFSSADACNGKSCVPFLSRSKS
jgi:hypothetical protein